MRGIISRSPLEFPGRAPKLNYNHPAVTAGKLRLAVVARGDGSFLDLLTQTTGVWLGSNGAGGEIGPYGPMSYPLTLTSGGVPFPALYAGETFTQGVTLSCIFTPRQMTRGQGYVNTSQTTTEGANVVKLSTNAASGFFFGVGGSGFTFGPTSLTTSHLYFGVASMRGTAPNPRCIMGLVDMTTGQKWTSTTTATVLVTVGSHYSVLTYNGGNVDNNRLGQASITARGITPGEMASWMDDPYSLWYMQESTNFILPAGSYVFSPSSLVAMSFFDVPETFAISSTAKNNLSFSYFDPPETFQMSTTTFSVVGMSYTDVNDSFNVFVLNDTSGDSTPPTPFPFSITFTQPNAIVTINITVEGD
jgi:hypothetical protein